MLDNSGKHLISPIYDDLRDANNPALIGANLKGKWGFIDTTGRVKIPHQFKAVSDFHEGYAWVQNFKDTWHIIDETGKLSDTLNILASKHFASGLAPVQFNSQWSYVNTLGEQVNDKTYIAASAFDQGIAIVKTANGYGAINTTFEMVVPDRYARLTPDKYGYLAKEQGKYFYLNPIGKKRWRHEGYDKALSFECEHTVIKQEDQWYIINNKGSIISKPSYDKMTYGGECTFKIKQNDLWGFVNKDGEVICQPRFNSTFQFEEGKVVVSDGELWGYYDANCNELLPPQFSLAWGYKNSYARVIADRTIQMIDDKGAILPNIQHIELRDFNNGLARFQYFPFLEDVLNKQ